MRFLYAIITGGIARQASLNHRLKSGKPPACPGGLAITAAFAKTAAFTETALPQKPLSRNISYLTGMRRQLRVREGRWRAAGEQDRQCAMKMKPI
jgi:hypothetical protein